MDSDSFLDLVVHWEDDTPVVAATVVFARPGRVLDSGITDGEGLLRVRSMEAEDAELYVLQGNGVLLHRPLPARAGEARLEVPLGGAVRGVVRIGGEVPEGPVLVRLSILPGKTGPPTAPPLLDPFVDWRLRGWREVRTATDAMGGFTFGGLSADWSGELGAVGNLSFDAEEATLFLPEPTSGVVLDLAPFPAIRGRVLSPAGAPVAGCALRILLFSEDQIATDDERTGPDGRLLVPFEGEGPARVSLEFHAEGVGRANLEAELDPVVGVDLGDVRLARGGSVRFRVEDTEGRPVAGAFPILASRRGRPSGSDGMCWLEDLPPGERTVAIVAPDYRPREVVVEPSVAGAQGAPDGQGGAGPLRVVLEKGGRLEVLLRDADGAPVVGARVIADGDPLFLTETGGLDLLQGSLWEERPFPIVVDPDVPGSWRGPVEGLGSNSVVFPAATSDRVTLRNLAPDTRIHLSAADPLGTDLGWQDTVLLSSGEERTLIATLPTTLHVIEGVVLGKDGVPLVGATVALLPPMRASQGTDKQGRFRFPPYAVQPYDVAVHASGYVPQVEHIEDSSAPVPIQMDPGFDCGVTFVDVEGEIRQPDKVSAYRDGLAIGNGTPRADGSYGFPHAPHGAFGITATLWGGNVLFPMREEPRAVLRLPEPGYLRVAWPFELSEGDRASVRVQHTSATDSGLHHPLTSEELEAGWADIPEVLPGDSTVSWVAIHPRGNADLLATETIHVAPGEIVEVE